MLHLQWNIDENEVKRRDVGYSRALIYGRRAIAFAAYIIDATRRRFTIHSHPAANAHTTFSSICFFTAVAIILTRLFTIRVAGILVNLTKTAAVVVFAKTSRANDRLYGADTIVFAITFAFVNLAVKAFIFVRA